MLSANLWEKLRKVDEQRAIAILESREALKAEIIGNEFTSLGNSSSVSRTQLSMPNEAAKSAERQRWISAFRARAEGDTRRNLEEEARKQRAENESQPAQEPLRVKRRSNGNVEPLTKIVPPSASSLATVATVPLTVTPQATTDSSLEQCLQRLKQREFRSEVVVKLDKGNKALKSIKLFLTMLTNTKRDLRLRLDGTPQEPGPRPLLDYVEKKAPQQLDAAMQVIADRIVHCASNNLAIDALLRGEANYALVYLTLMICLSRPAFVDILRGSLEAACPFIQPGLKQHWENEAKSKNWPKETRKTKLGYLDGSEGDDEYLFRMQAITGFYSALLQTSPAVLKQYSMAMPYTGGASINLDNIVNPLGGLAEAWRWLAKTANGTKWRWTRFLVQAFLCVSGRDLSLVLPQQMTKFFKLLQSDTFKASCESSASHPNDDDRIRGFETFVKESLDRIKKDGALRGPGKLDEVDGKSVWVDPRDLPEGAILNMG